LPRPAASAAGAADANIRIGDSETLIPADYNSIMPRFGFAWSLPGSDRLVLRGGYGIFYERTTGGFANSLRQSPPFFREVQLNNLGDWNTVPEDIPSFPLPAFQIGFDDLHTQDLIQGLERAAAFDQVIQSAVKRMNMAETLILFTADHSYDFRVFSGRRGALDRH
jgi:hypothetical protein